MAFDDRTPRTRTAVDLLRDAASFLAQEPQRARDVALLATVSAAVRDGISLLSALEAEDAALFKANKWVQCEGCADWLPSPGPTRCPDCALADGASA